MDTTITHRRRGKRRSHKTLRTVMLLLSGLAAPTGMGMSLWGFSEQNPLPLSFGLANIALSGACLLVWAIIRHRQHPSPDHRESRSIASPANSGMALLVSLLMLALLSGMALHAMVSAGMDLRFARERHTACLLRTAGTDAIWTTLHEAVTLSPDTLARYDRILPGGPGIETLTSLREVDRSALPPPLLLQNTPLFGRFFSITSLITRDKVTREIRALACLMPTGELRVLSWTEPL